MFIIKQFKGGPGWYAPYSLKTQTKNQSQSFLLNQHLIEVEKSKLPFSNKAPHSSDHIEAKATRASSWCNSVFYSGLKKPPLPNP